MLDPQLATDKQSARHPASAPDPIAKDRAAEEPPEIATGLAGLSPSYFAAVMATGIISIACFLEQWTTLALGLVWLNVVGFLILVGLNAVRICVFPANVWNDLTDHKRGVGFFTLVAAVCVLGAQFAVIAKMPAVATTLWAVGIGLWFLLTYLIFSSLVVKQTKPSLPAGIHGGWLVSVVAAQSVAVLGGLLAPYFAPNSDPMLFFCLVMWLGGGMLYVWIISLIFYRYSFFEMSPHDMEPAYWINMGAMAISTLAGTTLIAAAGQSPLLSQLLPFLKGGTIMFWATATWWIPMLITLGIWRHGVKRFGFQYDPRYWGLVFPLGMYSACTFQLSKILDLSFLSWIPPVFAVLALLAWLLTMVGMIFAILGLMRRRRSAAPRWDRKLP